MSPNPSDFPTGNGNGVGTGTGGGIGSILTGRRAVSLFLAFAVGYFFSALLRAVTATLAPQFSSELGLSAADLGLLAGVFFAGFACTQLPLGSALDRHGPKRVLLAFMVVAVVACAAFALADSFAALLAARALMGVGLSAGLMAALTSFRHAYSPVMQFRASSWMLMTGSLGMLTSTLPVHALLPVVGWRGLFWLCALGLIGCVGLIAWIVPRDRAADAPRAAETAGAWTTYRFIWAHPTFRRMMPMGFWHYGGLIAVQTLWAGPWLTQVLQLDAASAARGLFLINLAMLVSFASLGVVVPRLTRRGWNTDRLVNWAAPISACLLLAIAISGASAGPFAMLMWCVSCVLLSLCQPAVGQAFRAELVGRALSAFNLVIFLGVFCLQWGIGGTIDALRAMGWSNAAAHQGAMGVLGLGCVACWLWFLRGRQTANNDLASAGDRAGGKAAE